MNTIVTPPSYEELSRSLEKNLPGSHVAQIHGLMCGLICLHPEDPSPIKRLFPKLKNKNKTVTLLQQVYEHSFQQLNEFSFEFNLLLPDDSTDINVRAEALGLWCQGFLTEINKADPVILQNVSHEVSEALNDFVEIAKINFGDIATNDEDETAYQELAEYVRLSVLMIYNELQHPNYPEEQTSDDSHSLH